MFGALPRARRRQDRRQIDGARKITSPLRDSFPYNRRTMKKPTREQTQRMCTRKRRYRTQGDALDAARFAGVERNRSAYLCTICRHWHLTSK